MRKIGLVIVGEGVLNGHYSYGIKCWADLFERQIRSSIANTIPPTSDREQENFPLIFESNNPQNQPRRPPADAAARDKFAVVQQAINANDIFGEGKGLVVEGLCTSVMSRAATQPKAVR